MVRLPEAADAPTLDADGSILAGSAFSGNMLDDSGVNVKALGVVAKAKVWLGSGAKTQSVKADEVRAESLLTLLTALNRSAVL